MTPALPTRMPGAGAPDEDAPSAGRAGRRAARREAGTNVVRGAPQSVVVQRLVLRGVPNGQHGLVVAAFQETLAELLRRDPVERPAAGGRSSPAADGRAATAGSTAGSTAGTGPNTAPSDATRGGADIGRRLALAVHAQLRADPASGAGS